jgi:hypothetical protein
MMSQMMLSSTPSCSVHIVISFALKFIVNTMSNTLLLLGVSTSSFVIFMIIIVSVFLRGGLVDVAQDLGYLILFVPRILPRGHHLKKFMNGFGKLNILSSTVSTEYLFSLLINHEHLSDDHLHHMLRPNFLDHNSHKLLELV